MTEKEQFETTFEGLHVHGQAVWHDAAYIVGTRAGIQKLRDALDAALAAEDGTAMAEEVFANDGEGYQVNVHVLPYAEFSPLACPYTDEIARYPVDSFWPWHLAVKPKRKEPTTTPIPSKEQTL